jgi:hypothetical protein
VSLIQLAIPPPRHSPTSGLARRDGIRCGLSCCSSGKTSVSFPESPIHVLQVTICGNFSDSRQLITAPIITWLTISTAGPSSKPYTANGVISLINFDTNHIYDDFSLNAVFGGNTHKFGHTSVNIHWQLIIYLIILFKIEIVCFVIFI